ncbi:hypothetical protein D187_000784 [Cystobacter fuscus DSM 2262]|uniref:Uncharacterized protein n=1 Tax=Cystobacter fuscus (strain ATCC 25194 / DSM 2262 / NBRC 100088 / M29) TaxID=1242864 RepID=S9R8C7_CYSF2|nr:hypothetical protein D187_000784 [Cystobacter fuscus DSM 2262]
MSIHREGHGKHVRARSHRRTPRSSRCFARECARGDTASGAASTPGARRRPENRLRSAVVAACSTVRSVLHRARDAEKSARHALHYITMR